MVEQRKKDDRLEAYPTIDSTMKYQSSMIHHSMLSIRNSMVAALLVVLCGLSQAAELSKPNVLLLISNDQGYGDFGFTGNRVVKTPHLDQFRILAHVKKGESFDLVREKITLANRDWHPVHIVLKGETITVIFNGRTWAAKHPAVAEPKDNIGFGGGPDGEKAGALEFRNLVITSP
jgi:hypothetical protein